MNIRKDGKCPPPTPPTVNGEEFKQRAIFLFNQICRIAFGLTGSEDEAMDLVQDTYLKAWTAIEQFTPGANIKVWLAKIAYNTFVNGYHKKNRGKPVGEGRFVDNRRGPSEALLENVMDKDIEKALKSLAEEFRSAIVLVDIGEMNYEESAMVLNSTVGAVRSRLSGGRALLKKKLYEHAKSMEFTK